MYYFQEQIRMMLPNFLQQLQNPEVHNLMANPQALGALVQIQQGVEQLRNVAPGLVNRYVDPLRVRYGQ
jgi:ubiquilin